jgi:hypothetical protein
MDNLKNKYNVIALDFSMSKPPEIKEEKNKDYVCFGTEKQYRNNYPQYLLDLYNRSSKHRALVDGKVEFLTGRGWKVEQNANVTNQAIAQAKAFIAAPNPDETLNRLNYLTNFDDVLYGGYYLEIIWSNDRESIAEVNYMDFRYLRTNEDKTFFYYTQDWTQRKPENNEDWEVIPAFDVNNRGGKQILAVDCSNSKEVYPLPSYLPAVPLIEADYELANFDLNNIKNQFVPSFMISFNNGIPTDEEAELLERQIADKFAGTDNGGKFILNFSDSKDRSAEITPITPSNLDKQYQILEERIDSALTIGHRVINPILFGWASEGTGFSNNADEMRVAHSSFQHRYVTPKQESKEDLFNSILLVNGVPGILEIKPLEPVKAQIDNATMVANLTQEEIREMIGMDELEGATTNPVADAIGLISPLVATKVLDNMTIGEIRALVGLPEVSEVTRTTTTTTTDFNEDKDVEAAILDHFSNCGYNEDDFEILSFKELECTNIEEFLIEDDKAKAELHKFAAIPGLSTTDLAVLQQLQNNADASTTDIARALKITEDEVAQSLAKLESTGAIATSETDGLIRREVTPDGVDTIEVEDIEPTLMVVYRYALRSDAPPLKTRSRDFCIRLMAQRKLYERDEINTLNNGMGLDVFQYRGGWYNNPRTGRKTKWCRHIWQQTIVRRKQQ